MSCYKFVINGQTYEVAIKTREGSNVNATVNGVDYSLTVENAGAPARAEVRTPKTVVSSPAVKTASVPAASPKVPKTVSPGAVLAPIPGQIKSVAVNEGDVVTKGQKLLVMEAMKLENEITAPMAGKIEKVLVKPSDVVSQDQELVRIGV